MNFTHGVHSKYLFKAFTRFMSSKQTIRILGIETSCDDTGVAVVNEKGLVLGEVLQSQANKSVKFGGVIPTVARKYHEKHIAEAVDRAILQSDITVKEINAVAVTIKPGNLCSLRVGADFAKSFSNLHSIPFIPIHHMIAHGLTVTIKNKVEFPFVVLLVSGGHCILAVAESLSRWSVVGETLDISPGNLLDQIARRLKLKNLVVTRDVIGGKAIEILAKDGDPKKFNCLSPMSHYRNANFSFSGLYSHFTGLIQHFEQQDDIEGGRVLSEVHDICASLQYNLVKHLVRQTHKGLQFLELSERIKTPNKTLVLSGGVAANVFLCQAFEKLCDQIGYRLLIPPSELCTDNGVMVAWNGVLKWLAGQDILTDPQQIHDVAIEHKCPLGENISNEHTEMNLKNPKWIKI